MREPLLVEILRSIEEIEGLRLPTEARSELTGYFPMAYAKFEQSIGDKSGLTAARYDYMSIMRMYMISNRIPLTVENLACAFLWGFSNLKDRGIENAPMSVKKIIGYVRKSLEPEVIRLEEQYMK